MSYDAGEVRDVKDKKTKARIKRDGEVEDIKQILALPFGRRVLWRILSQCKMFHECFTGNSTTFYNEGKRSVGLWLTTEITEADVNGYLKMQKEHLDNG